MTKITIEYLFVSSDRAVSGRGRRRLDCVRLGRSDPCDGRKCQLCKMKQSQCEKIMFVIEGARCLGRDGQDAKCSPSKRCQYCRELQERHGPSMLQTRLENVLYSLQAHHGCHVHFTRGYNETITSLLLLREIFGSMVGGQETPHDDMARAIALSLGSPQQKAVTALPLDLTYDTFCSNARRRTGDTSFVPPCRGKIVEWNAESLVRNIHAGQIGLKLSDTFESKRSSRADDTEYIIDDDRKVPAKEDIDRIIQLDDDDDDGNNPVAESQSSIEILEPDGWAPVKTKQSSKSSNGIINIDSDSEGSIEAVQVIESASLQPPNAAARGASRKRRADHDVAAEQSKRKRNVDVGTVENLNSAGLRLFIVSGLYEYDTDFHSDANKIWKQLYAQNSSDHSGLASTAKQQLQQLQQSETPFVDRDSILFWILYLQVKYGIIFHAPRRTSCRDELRLYWSGSESNEAKAGGRAASLRSDCSTRTPMLTPKPPPTATTGSSLRKASSTSPTFARAPRPPSSSRRTEEAREARLRRFGGLTPHSSMLSQNGGSGSLQWECSKCTFLNDNSSPFCAMCQESGGSSSRTSVTDTNQSSSSWNCERCTFQNHDVIPACEACGHRNPFQIGNGKSSSYATPTVSSKRPPPSVVGTVLGTSVGTTSKVRCAACGQRGHNRGTATASNCPAYHDEAEIQLRNKKKEAAERKAREARDRIEELAREDEESKRQLEEVQRAMAELRRTTENRTSLTENERRRLEKERTRAEKRARKFA